MSSKRYPEEFKIEAVKQITENRYPIVEVASKLGVSQHSLYTWVKQHNWHENRLHYPRTLKLPATEKRGDVGT